MGTGSLRGTKPSSPLSGNWFPLSANQFPRGNPKELKLLKENKEETFVDKSLKAKQARNEYRNVLGLKTKEI